MFIILDHHIRFVGSVFSACLYECVCFLIEILCQAGVWLVPQLYTGTMVSIVTTTSIKRITKKANNTVISDFHPSFISSMGHGQTDSL